MKIVLVCLNSKYVHTSLAIWYIKEYLKSYDAEVECIDTTIHCDLDELTQKIASLNPDVVGLSTYIFNVQKVVDLLKKLRPYPFNLVIGGPEAEFNKQLLPLADTVMTGEGETAWEKYLLGDRNKLIFGEETAEIAYPYGEEYFENANGKIAYFEASRGCPFSCSYCMSGIKRLRYFDIEKVKTELLKFKDKNIRVLKFVDRTFNANQKLAGELLKFIIENFKNQNITFHFEVAPELFDENLFEIIATARSGLLQFEAGVQTLNSKSLEAVNRGQGERALLNLKRLVALKNCHVHTDLIAGLPYENYASFRESFNRLFEVGAEQLQLGFLKILKGSKLENELPDGYVISKNAPYEIQKTPWLSEFDLERLKYVNEGLERVYNSQKFNSIINFALKYSTPFDFFLKVGESLSPMCDLFQVYDIVLQQAVLLSGEARVVDALLRFDYLSANPSKNLPPCLPKHFDKSFKHEVKSHESFDPKLNYFFFEVNPFDLSFERLAIGFDYSAKNKVTGTYPYKILRLNPCNS